MGPAPRPGLIHDLSPARSVFRSGRRRAATGAQGCRRPACWPRRAMPVTRWNRKYLLAGAGALAAIVGLGFYIGFGGAYALALGRPRTRRRPQTRTIRSSPRSPALRPGYGDPAVKAAETPPGVVDPAAACGRRSGAGGRGLQRASRAGARRPGRAWPLAQAKAARASGPFFAGAQGEVAPEPDRAPAPRVCRPAAEAALMSGTSAEVQAPERPGREAAVRRRRSRADDYLTNPLARTRSASGR